MIEILLVLALSWNIVSAEGLSSVAVNTNCEAFASGSSQQSPTDRWIAAMARLENRVDLLSPAEFRAWVKELAKGELALPDLVQVSEGVMWRRVFEGLRASGEVERERVRERAVRQLAEANETARDRATAEHITRDLKVQAQFVDTGWTVEDVDLPVPPAEDLSVMDDPRDWESWPVEVMSTPFTQWMWTQLMGFNPSHFRDSGNLVVGGRTVFLNTNHPVEDVSLEQIRRLLLFLNDPNSPVEKIKAVIPDHEPGDLYNLPNYRFYKEMKMEWGEIVFDGKNRVVEEYVWFEENSPDGTQAVGQLKPLFINGKPVYDWFGNVAEFSLDMWLPVANGSYLATPCGGSYSSMRSVFSRWEGPGFGMGQSARCTDSFPSVGFRLVRTRSPFSRSSP